MRATASQTRIHSVGCSSNPHIVVEQASQTALRRTWPGTRRRSALALFQPFGHPRRGLGEESRQHQAVLLLYLSFDAAPCKFDLLRRAWATRQRRWENRLANLISASNPYATLFVLAI